MFIRMLEFDLIYERVLALKLVLRGLFTMCVLNYLALLRFRKLIRLSRYINLLFANFRFLYLPKILLFSYIDFSVVETNGHV